jgi:hypothetical protein
MSDAIEISLDPQTFLEFLKLQDKAQQEGRTVGQTLANQRVVIENLRYLLWDPRAHCYLSVAASKMANTKAADILHAWCDQVPPLNAN